MNAKEKEEGLATTQDRGNKRLVSDSRMKSYAVKERVSGYIDVGHVESRRCRHDQLRRSS